MNDKVKKILDTQVIQYTMRELNLKYCGIDILSLEVVRYISKNFPNLERLILNFNQIYSIANNIYDIKNLRYLHLKYNKLSALPKEICYIKNLTHLYLNNNSITALPSLIGQHKNLIHLNLRFNELTSLPKQIYELPNLRFINLNHNPIDNLINKLSTPKGSNLSILQSVPDSNKNNSNNISLFVPVDILELITKEIEDFKAYLESSDIHNKKRLVYIIKGNQIIIRIEGDDTRLLTSELEQYIELFYQRLYSNSNEFNAEKLKQEVVRSIQQDKIDQAIDLLSKHFEISNKNIYYELIVHKTQLFNLKKFLRNNNITYIEFYSETKKIIRILLEYLEEINQGVVEDFASNNQSIKELGNYNKNLFITNLNVNHMEFKGKTQNFQGATFNEFKGNVIHYLNSNNKFNEIDEQMFSVIESLTETDEQKKELINAVVEIKSDKTDDEKTLYKNRLIKFLNENKEIIATVFKMGVSAVLGYYGLLGSDKLIGLE